MPTKRISVRNEWETRRPASWISESEIEAMLAHPALPSCLSSLIDGLIALHTGDPLLNRLLGDRGRQILGLFVSYLDVVPLPGHDAAGATLGGLQALCRHTGLCSPGRAAATIAAMRFGGYLVSEIDRSDGRKRRLVPSARFRAERLRQWQLQYEAMQDVLPRAADILPHLVEQHFVTELLRRLGVRYLDGERVLAHAPVLASLAERHAGLLILAGLVTREWRSDSPASALPISISALARTFAASRSHVRDILREAECAGLLLRAPDGTSVIVRPALTKAIGRFFTAACLWLERCGSEALAATEPTIATGQCRTGAYAAFP